MGQVRFVQRTAIEQQLVAGNLVLLTNIGVSSSGELLNCNVFDVSCAPVGPFTPSVFLFSCSLLDYASTGCIA